MPLSQSQIASCFRHHEIDFPASFSATYYELFENPLLLSIGLKVINNGKLPNNRGLLYRYFTEKLYKDWQTQKEKSIINVLTIFEIENFLGHVALKYMDLPCMTKNDFGNEF